MASFKFLENSARHLAELTAQKVETGMTAYFTEINERLRKIEIKQKETSLQIEEMDSNFHSDGNESVFIDALITLADIIEDFYYYALEDKDSPLFEQAQMMWNTAKNKAETTGLTIIEAAGEPFDFNIHSIKGTTSDDSQPAGYVIKTIKCGYIFKNEVLRQAAVIVNKQEVIFPSQL